LNAASISAFCSSTLLLVSIIYDSSSSFLIQ
jgi:hypothetical protein